MKIFEVFDILKKSPYNGCMYELYTYFTNDGSVGLFSPEADDIYHSTYGALSEAFEKFIIPANISEFVKKNNEIKILDICYGIGYNSKSFLNTILDFLYSETIGDNKIKCNDKIGCDNIKRKIFIHAIDIDKNLAYLSPFFVSDKKNVKNDNLKFEQNKIKGMLSGRTVPRYSLRKEVNILLLQKFFKYIDSETEDLLFSKKYSDYFDKFMTSLYRFYKKRGYKQSPYCALGTFLHNIYYQYISKSHKNAINTLKLLDFDFNLEIRDARLAIKDDNNRYNFIFLDAFTPTKCPCLWTIDFFKLLYNHLENDGMILTYSNSALVRNAFINAGFYVGKIFSESSNNFTGTIAVKNKTFIKHELSEYDLGLIKTKAGIFYQDKDLTLDNEAIIAAHKIEVENSDLMSSSRYIKSNRYCK